MKKLISKIHLLFAFALLITSCNKNDSDSAETTPQKSNISSIGIAKKCIECKNTDSKTYFYIGANASVSYIDNKNTSLSLLNESIFKEKPIKIYFDENNPSKILYAEEINETEKKSWQSNFSIQKITANNLQELTKKNIENKQLSMNFTWTEAVNFFNTIKNSSCLSTNYSNGCIPFQYANDGCYARAHAMRRYLTSINKDCYKYFAYGNLWVNTATSPSVCKIGWRYHVAPMIYTNNNWYIIDPSLFSEPKLYTVWLDKMKYNGGTVTTTRYTSSDVYYYDYQTNYTMYDNTYSDTNNTMNNYRYKQTICM
jgi:hypothetical protein